ncbi:MAG: hypothetical protein P8J45_12380 [Phycisphaerales bacterium]|nr:hypothetical protein [Phycisphaerales bacterium]
MPTENEKHRRWFHGHRRRREGSNDIIVIGDDPNRPKDINGDGFVNDGAG